ESCSPGRRKLVPVSQKTSAPGASIRRIPTSFPSLPWRPDPAPEPRRAPVHGGRGWRQREIRCIMGRRRTMAVPGAPLRQRGLAIRPAAESAPALRVDDRALEAIFGASPLRALSGAARASILELSTLSPLAAGALLTQEGQPV